MKYQPYPKYKDSGVEWIGEIPEDWGLRRTKHVASLELSNIDKHTVDGEPPVLLCNYTDVYKNLRVHSRLEFMVATASPDQIDRLRIMKGDLILTKDSESPDDIGVPALVVDQIESLVCGYHLCLIRPRLNLLHSGFGLWWYSGAQSKAYFETEAVGMTRFALGKYSLSNQKLALPSSEIQSSIASFLDTETAKIDTLVREYEDLIALLTEKRQALISHAVTRGLSELVDPQDPEFGPWAAANLATPVRFVDSGVEWLGEIPEGWKVKKLKFILRHEGLVRGPFGGDLKKEVFAETGFKVYEQKNAIYADSDLGDSFVTKEKFLEMRRFEVRPGDFILSCSGTVGKLFMIPSDAPKGIINQALLIMRLGPMIVAGFFSWTFKAHYLESQIFDNSQGGAMKNLVGMDVFTSIKFSLPGTAEQSAIAAFLTRETTKIDTLVRETHDAIELLKEHRSALITAAVTGKINVEALE